MILEISNVACVKKASIELDGITVVSGKNGAGKSTIAKALSALVSSNNKLDDDIRYQREKNVSRWLEDFNFSLKVVRDRSKPSQYEEFRPFRIEIKEFADRVIELYESGKLSIKSLGYSLKDFFYVDDKDIVISGEKFSSLKTILETPRGDLEKYTVYRAFNEKFNNQINSFCADDSAVVSLTVSDRESTSVEFKNNKVTSYASFESKSARRLSSVFLESPSRFNGSSTREVRINPSLTRLLKKDIPGDEIYEDFKKGEESLESVDSYIQEIIHGKFVKESESQELTFKDDSKEEGAINLSNVASGVKVFALIRRLIENRSISDNSILIIDEPETGLHPEWQVKFAGFLGLISKEIGVRMLLTTHSPYFLRAVEVMAEDISFVDNVKYYIMNDFSALDVTGKTEVIYKELYKPLEEL